MEKLRQPTFNQIKQSPLASNQVVIYSVMSILFIMVCSIAYVHNASQEKQLLIKDEIIKQKDALINKKDHQLLRMIEIDRLYKNVKKDSI